MSKVFTGNVFLTTSREALDKVFFSKNRIKKVSDGYLTLTEKELKNSFLVSPQKNSNLIEFDFSFGFEESKKFSLRLKFLETDTLFETFFVGKSTESLLLAKLFDALTKIPQTSDPLQRDIAGAQNNDSLKEVEKVLFNSQSDIILNGLRIYFAYGVGDTLEDWGGPFVASLTGGNILNTNDGVKQVELVFSPTGEFFLSNKADAKIEQGVQGAVDTYNRIVSNRSLIKGDALITIDSGKGLPVKNAWDRLSENSHFYITSLVEKYIQNISQSKNVIVLVPDLDKIVQKLLQNYEFIPDIPRSPNQFKEFSDKMNILIASRAIKNSSIQNLNSLGIFITKKFGGIGQIPLLLEESQEKLVTPEDITISMVADNAKSESLNPDYFEPLQRFIDGARSYYSKAGIKTDVIFFEESDIKTLKLWKKYGFIGDDTKPCNLFVSIDLAESLLYIRNKNKENLEKIDLNNIHKIDLDKFNKATYRKEYYDTFLKTPISSSFKENVLLKDELALPGVKEIAKDQNIPIFKYNLRNSNILGISVDYNGSYLAAYNYALRKKALIPFINASQQTVIDEAEKIIPKDLRQKIEKSIKDVDNIDFATLQKEIFKLYSEENIKQNPDFLLSIKTEQVSETLTKNQLATYIALLIDSSRLTDKPGIFIENDDEAVVQREILESLVRTVVTVSIKTLPFFKLSCNAAWQRKVILLALQNSIIGSENVKKLLFYSGVYTITGFRHYISDNEMYSEFSLVRTDFTDSQATQAISTDGNISIKKMIAETKEFAAKVERIKIKLREVNRFPNG